MCFDQSGQAPAGIAAIQVGQMPAVKVFADLVNKYRCQ